MVLPNSDLSLVNIAHNQELICRFDRAGKALVTSIYTKIYQDTYQPKLIQSRARLLRAVCRPVYVTSA